jgi:FMN phosphatase YigB (HAD superfamily)
MTSIQVCFFDLGKTLVEAGRRWLPGTQALLGTLREKGVRLGIISNTTGLGDRQAILDILPVDFDLGLFEPPLVLFSSEVGLAKPRPEIFEQAVARAAVPARHCLYCSESIVETLVAQHVGMLAIRVQEPPHSDVAGIEQPLVQFELAIRST